jgi:hypothetical protein
MSFKNTIEGWWKIDVQKERDDVAVLCRKALSVFLNCQVLKVLLNV